MAATVIRRRTGLECIVLAVERGTGREEARRALHRYFGSQPPLVAFSTLHGRRDLFDLAGDLKAEGAATFLAGPQAGLDYAGETGCDGLMHRFQGYADRFDFALRGPAEQVVPYLRRYPECPVDEVPGAVFLRRGILQRNDPLGWDEDCLAEVDWDNLYAPVDGDLAPVPVSSAQVLQQIGCPYAARKRRVALDYPAGLTASAEPVVELELRGCSFCDVASDKGFYGTLDLDTVMRQIRCLPEHPSGGRIRFELINENPLPGLRSLLERSIEESIRLTQIDLTMRADWLVRGEPLLRRALDLAQRHGVRIMASSVGFEAFDDRILRNLNKGVSAAVNLEAVRLMRRIKEDYPHTWAYSRQEGSVHGFIHPTPWDDSWTQSRTRMAVYSNDLPADILPRTSVPLIVHHGCGLGEWIRTIEAREQLRFPRTGSHIAWWEEP
jgi:hypothetical protein